MKRIILIVCFLFLNSCIYQEIKENRGDAIAQIIEKHGVRGGYNFTYKYKINNIEYTEIGGLKLDPDCIDKYMNKYFPIVYSKKNPEKSIIIITPNDCERWGIGFPDSLNWVRFCMYH